MKRPVLLLCVALTSACSGAANQPPKTPPRPKGPTVAEYRVEAVEALVQLRAGQFEEARRQAEAVAKKRDNPYADLVRGITHFKTTMHALSADLRKLFFATMRGRGTDHATMRNALTVAERDLGVVAQSLERVAAHRDLTLDLCLACWEVDWNHNGRVDIADRRLFQIEKDADGNRIPDDSARRKPTFRFDHGDVQWALAFVNFQRAAMNLVLAYKWTQIDRLFSWKFDKTKPVVIPLEQPARVKAAKELIVAGLTHADLARKAYLAETDDRREWLPNPRQKDHPMPLPVDEALYTTWEQVVGDLQKLVKGQEGLSVSEIAQLGDHKWEVPPRGYINVGKMLDNPKDIVLDLSNIDNLKRSNPQDIEELLTMVLGDTYVPTMTATKLMKRMKRMKGEIKRGEESLERKFRYLIWLN